MNRYPLVIAALLLAASFGLPGPSAQETAPQEPETAESVPPTAEERREERRKAKEDRIAEYLRKREEKRLEREAAAAAGEPAAEAPSVAPASARPRTERPKERRAAAETERTFRKLPRDLASAQKALRLTQIAKDPTIRHYMKKIDENQVNAQQLAAFGSFLADAGLSHIAVSYYEAALRLDRKDPLLWNNLGTIRRNMGDYSEAKTAFSNALDIDPANAVAHYNVGAILDQQGKYNRALREYRIALSLDPTLGDPEYNPGAANNDRLLAVKLMLYQEQAGNAGMPLLDVAGGDINGVVLPERFPPR